MAEFLDEQVGTAEPAGEELVQLVARTGQAFRVHRAQLLELGDAVHQFVEAVGEPADRRCATDFLVDGGLLCFHAFSLLHRGDLVLRGPGWRAPPVAGRGPPVPLRVAAVGRGAPPFLSGVWRMAPAAFSPVPAGCQAGTSCFLPLPIRSARPISFKASRSNGQFSGSW
ncbi:hypothetical protein SDC9_119626 [bioreactor metagenome]|uniref:Uncharacterized protein n=1 Tax=bioreactor metagenome TaxID=1076179 RepID=A0A645C4F4_9ZZZZ